MVGMAPVTSRIKGQWLRYIMRVSENNIVKPVMEWKPRGKIPQGRPRKCESMQSQKI